MRDRPMQAFTIQPKQWRYGVFLTKLMFAAMMIVEWLTSSSFSLRNESRVTREIRIDAHRFSIPVSDFYFFSKPFNLSINS